MTKIRDTQKRISYFLSFFSSWTWRGDLVFRQTHRSCSLQRLRAPPVADEASINGAPEKPLLFGERRSSETREFCIDTQNERCETCDDEAWRSASGKADFLPQTEPGTKVFYRLGSKIEHTSKKYGTLPPPDFQKWAEICEHIIRHYTEGWANGYHWDIEYWEIWNEPDLHEPDTPKEFKAAWGGTIEQFHELFRITAKHLKSCFPHLKIGGLALAFREKWADDFLAAMKADNVRWISSPGTYMPKSRNGYLTVCTFGAGCWINTATPKRKASATNGTMSKVGRTSLFTRSNRSFR